MNQLANPLRLAAPVSRAARATLATLLVALSGAPQAQVRQDAPGAPASSDKGGWQPEAEAESVSALAAETLKSINAYRAAGATCGTQRMEPVGPLAWNARLERTADLHAQEMASRRTMTHSGADGSSVGQRMQRQGYEWMVAGENVSAGYKSVPEALAGWMRSPGHCSNMMSPDFREVGVAGALAPGDTYGWYRAMVLGWPKERSPRQPLLMAPVAGIDADAVLARVNAWRTQGTQCGARTLPPAPPLAWEARLAQVGHPLARDLVRSNVANAIFPSALAGHQRPESGAFGALFAGGDGPRKSVEEMLAAWAGDANRCASLMAPTYTQVVLVGLAPNGQAARGAYWALVLARP